MTNEQIANWRKVIGIAALLMSDEDIEAIRHNMQNEVNMLNKTRPTNIERPMVNNKQRISPEAYRGTKKCDHSNSISGSKGKYCIDCEMYIR